MKSFKAIYVVCLHVVFYACSKNIDVEVCTKDIRAVEKKSDYGLDDYELISLTPLENNTECLIHEVDKVLVTSNNYIVLDNSNSPSIFSFTCDGAFCGKIAKIGHAKSEISHVLDVAEKKDTVYVLQYDKIKLYDINGGYIKTIELNNSNHWERIVSAENGFVCSSYYTGVQNLVSVCDKDFRTLYSFANTEEMTFAEFPYLRNPIWCSHGKIIYCNFFSSSFYVSEQNSPSVVCYNIISDRQMTHEKVLAGKWGYEDYFLTFSFDGKCIFGYMNYNKRFCRYVFDISNNDFSVFLPMDFLPQIQAYCNGYYYSLISAHDVLSIAESAKTRKDGGYDKLYELFSPFMNKITDGDNYFVLKMKKK